MSSLEIFLFVVVCFVSCQFDDSCFFNLSAQFVQMRCYTTVQYKESDECSLICTTPFVLHVCEPVSSQACDSEIFVDCFISYCFVYCFIQFVLGLYCCTTPRACFIYSHSACACLKPGACIQWLSFVTVRNICVTFDGLYIHQAIDTSGPFKLYFRYDNVHYWRTYRSL